MLKKTLLIIAVIAAAAPMVAPLDAPAQAQDGIAIEWWSDGADSPARVAVIERIAADYMAAHPDVTITLAWWEPAALHDGLQDVLAGTRAAPDITSLGDGAPDWIAADRLLPLDDMLPWDSMVGVTLPGQGEPAHYTFSLSATVMLLFYNPDLFAELGISVPDDHRFSADAFVQVVESCAAAGYVGVASGILDNSDAAAWVAQLALFNRVGGEAFGQYDNGRTSWNTPEARSALAYSAALRSAGMWPPGISTLTLEDAMRAFHTERRACMLVVPSWYADYAFRPVEDGGQDPGWHAGMLRYPAFEEAAAPDSLWAMPDPGYGILASSEQAAVAQDILAFAAQPGYGALWAAATNTPSTIRYEAADWPTDDTLAALGVDAGQWAWYWDEYHQVYGELTLEVVPRTRCEAFDQAATAVLNEGLPLDLISVDEAVMMLDMALCE